MRGKSYKIYLIFAISLTAILFWSDTALSNEALKLADSLMEQGHYEAAITEYKRFIFFNPEIENTSYASYKMGLAYRAEYRWQQAIDALKTSVSATKDPMIAGERRITLATTLIASGNYGRARLELIKLYEFGEYPQIRQRALYFSGIGSLYMYDWDATSKLFTDFYSEFNDPGMRKRANEVNIALIKARETYKSPKRAKYLSTIVPGLGQMYAGYWRDGLNALILNGISIGLVANEIRKGNYIGGILILSVLSRYYTGNIYRAELDVIKRNEYLNRQNALEITNIVQVDEPM